MELEMLSGSLIRLAPRARPRRAETAQPSPSPSARPSGSPADRALAGAPVRERPDPFTLKENLTRRRRTRRHERVGIGRHRRRAVRAGQAGRVALAAILACCLLAPAAVQAGAGIGFTPPFRTT